MHDVFWDTADVMHTTVRPRQPVSVCTTISAVIFIMVCVLGHALSAQADQRRHADKSQGSTTLNPLTHPNEFVVPFAPADAERITPDKARDLKVGTLLVSTERVSNPRLERTVILILKHLTSGSRGIVLNRPTSIVLGEIRVQSAGEPGDSARVHFGGPIDKKHIRYLLKGYRSHTAEAQLANNVWFGTREDVLDAAAQRVSGQNLRLYAGHVGWLTGELRQQLNRGEWLVAPSTPENLFARDLGNLWQRLVNGNRRNDLAMTTRR